LQEINPLTVRVSYLGADDWSSPVTADSFASLLSVASTVRVENRSPEPAGGQSGKWKFSSDPQKNQIFSSDPENLVGKNRTIDPRGRGGQEPDDYVRRPIT